MSSTNQVYTSGSSPASSEFGVSIIEVKCKDGYNYPDFAATKFISCNAVGIWAPLVPCLSGHFLIYYLKFVYLEIFTIIMENEEEERISMN